MPALGPVITTILAKDVHCPRNTTPTTPIGRYERAGAHDAARAHRARRYACALERQHVRRREESWRVDGKKAHVCAGQDVAWAAALIGQGYA